MRIVHICLACFYVEEMEYQENILPKIHAQIGNEVYVLTSDFAFNSKGEYIKKKEDQYTNKYGVKVKILKRSRGLLARYGRFDGLYQELLRLKPDIIFVHGGTFTGLKDVTKYCKENSCKLYIDQHGDYYNSPVKSFKECLLRKGLYRHYIQQAVPYVARFWGVTPWRCIYLSDVFRVPREKIDLLLMGGDDEKIHFDQMPLLRIDMRRKLNISDDDFVLITGGKIDKAKNIHLLMEAVAELDIKKLKLIVFGQPNNDMEMVINRLADNDHIRFIGWINSDMVYDYFLSSDLAVFPGTHSVLWEQACACGIPCVFKDWEGMHHVDVGGNCVFIYNDSIEEIKTVIKNIYYDPEKYQSMKRIAMQKGVKTFSYSEIAKRAIGL